MTRQRQPKASAHALRQRYQALAMDAHPRFTGDQLLDALIRFKPHAGDQSPISYQHRLPALIREERVNTTIRKRSLDKIVTFFEHNWQNAFTVQFRTNITSKEPYRTIWNHMDLPCLFIHSFRKARIIHKNENQTPIKMVMVVWRYFLSPSDSCREFPM